MLKMPSDLQVEFTQFWIKKAVTKDIRFHYRKWLRYYLDFWHKYRFMPLDRESLYNVSGSVYPPIG